MDSLFKDIFDKYHQDLFRFLFYLVKNREAAEDLVQEVYIRVLKSYSRFEGKSSVKTWLFSIARNAAIDYFRKQKNITSKIFNRPDWKDFEIKADEPLPEDVAIENERVELLYRCMDFCTIDQRTVLITRFIQDLSIAETAEVLGWSESKVKTTQHRAIKVLRKHMEKAMNKEGSEDEK